MPEISQELDQDELPAEEVPGEPQAAVPNEGADENNKIEIDEGEQQGQPPLKRSRHESSRST